VIASINSQDWISVGQASLEFGLHPNTIRNWDKAGLLETCRTDGGHRRLSRKSIMVKLGLSQASDSDLPRVCIASRVSTPGQKDMLATQTERLVAYCAERWPEVEPIVVERIASGLNFDHPKFLKIIDLITRSEIDYLVISYKDRLCRLGYSLVSSLCEKFGVEIVSVNETEDKSFAENLVDELIALVTCMSAKHNGNKAAKTLTINLHEAALRRAYQLNKEDGLTNAEIATRLKEEGYTIQTGHRKGKHYTAYNVRKCLQESRATLDEILGDDVTDSFHVFCDEKIREADGESVLRSDLVAAYNAFCDERKLVKLNDQQIRDRCRDWEKSRHPKTRRWKFDGVVLVA
jgi:putative resolvase